MILSRKQIDEVSDLKTAVVEVPEWDSIATDLKEGEHAQVIVREATALERDEYDQSLVRTDFIDDKAVARTDFTNAKARLVVKCIIDTDGDRLYGDNEAAALGKKSAKVIRRLFDKIEELSGLTPKAKAATEKNSETGGTTSSASSLPGTSTSTAIK